MIFKLCDVAINVEPEKNYYCIVIVYYCKSKS